MRGNKGEWSEPYAALRIIGQQKIHVADRQGQANNNEWMSVIELMRNETRERIVNYRLSEDTTKVTISINDDPVKEMNVSQFMSLSKQLMQEILSSSGSSFAVSDALEHSLEQVEIHSIKAKSASKSDVLLSVRDPRSGITRNRIGFSIKSEFGHPPTLFNTASASAPIYRLDGMNPTLAEEINEMFDENEKIPVRRRCQKIIDQGVKMRFVGFPETNRGGVRISPFSENLEMLNPYLGKTIAALLLQWVLGNIKETGIPAVLQWLKENNPLHLTRPEAKYGYMLRSFLYASYCGLTASTLWDGRSEVNGGFIRVSKSGEVLAFYALESDNFKDYLFSNCFLERPSTNERHGNYGYVYKEGDNWFFRLNFQIRYRVG